MRRKALLGVIVLLVASGCAAPRCRQAHAPSFRKPISFSILEDYDKGEDLRQVEADFVLFRELGVTTWRGSFGWDDYEPARGEYDFEWLHRFAELAGRYGIALRPYVGYTPSWAARGGTDADPWNDPPARLADWWAFVFRLASAMQRHPNVLSFEMYNEENIPMWWDGSAADYNAVLQAGSEAVRAAGGDDQVLFGGMTFPDAEWLSTACVACDSGGSFDILPFHAYPETWSEEGVTVENYLDQGAPHFFLGDFVPAADAGCGPKPIWINETGFATVPGTSERDQANWWVRAMATFVAAPRVEHVGIYELKEPPRGAAVIGAPANYHLGITSPDRKKKLAFFTLQRLVNLLDTGAITVADGEAVPVVTGGREGELYHHLFIRPDGRQVLFVWDKTGSPTVAVRLARTGAAAIEYALDGTGALYGSFDGRTLRDIELAPGEARIFEIGPQGARTGGDR